MLPKIDGVGGRLLALRSYLRSNESLGERWSWTEAQIAAYEGSDEQVELNAEIERVRAAFEDSNPGYQLFVNPTRAQPRCPARQLEQQRVRRRCGGPPAARRADPVFSTPGSLSTSRGAALEAFLRSYVPESIPTVAAPGLSPHGQRRAVDFQVHRGPAIVAGPDTKTIGPVWDEGGWRAARHGRALREPEVHRPLISPREPWHYTYSPVTVAVH